MKKIIYIAHRISPVIITKEILKNKGVSVIITCLIKSTDFSIQCYK